MDRNSVEAVLDAAEEALAREASVDLGELGFWKVVGWLKRHPDLVEPYGRRVAAIDREAFERWVLLHVPLPVGTGIMVAMTVVGLVLIGLAYGYQGWPQTIALLVGTGIILVTTHGLTHLIVGSLQGMRFTHWFVGSIKFPAPGVKVDYSTYLRVPPGRRAWMHASAPIVTKFIPLVSLGAGLAMGAEYWVVWLLIVLTVVQVITDIIWSTKSSDWKKFRRERALARR